MRNFRKPGILNPAIGIDPNGVVGINDDTWVALTSHDDAIEVWNTRDLRKPAVTAELSVSVGSVTGMSIATRSDGALVATGFSPPQGGSDTVDVAQIRPDGKAISDYVQLSADAADYVFSPNGTMLATAIGSVGTSGFEALDPQDIDSDGSAGVLYPLDSSALYQRLCSIAARTRPESSWSKYLPATYYRPACS